AEALASANPGYPALTAAAAHSLGLASQDSERLAEAAAQHPDPWARASAAEDLGAWHARRADQEDAIHHLTQAINGYQLVAAPRRASSGARRAGAPAAAAGVGGRLRRLGGRRRHWTQSARRPATGWKSLTETEHTVSDLVAEGLNNRQIADRMYISVSTVAFYM